MATSQRQRKREGERERSQTKECQECGGQLVTDEKHGEKSCRECGLVVKSGQIDRGPDWRAFNSQEKQQKSRTGAAMTNLKHDKGLSTKIDWRDKDAYGNSLGSRQREKMQRLRTWNERYKSRNSGDRNLMMALGEIQRMASALGLPKSDEEVAAQIYRQALKNDLLRGRSIEGVASASLWTASRINQNPRTKGEIESVSRVKIKKISRAKKYIKSELQITAPIPTPTDFVPKICSELDLPAETETLALELANMAEEEGVVSGKSPNGLAAAAVYLAGLQTEHKPTQNELAAVAGVTEVTVRNRYKELGQAAIGQDILGEKISDYMEMQAKGGD